MRSLPPRAVETIAPGAPDCDLHIYHLEGRVAPQNEPRQAPFIGNWQEDDSAFLFFSTAAPAAIADLLRSQPGLIYRDHYRMTYDQWHGGRLSAFERGELRVAAAWHRDIPAGDPMRRPILLDPGVVFGAGTHPTTRDCLEALTLAYRNAVPTAALDLGTGSGLLALAAARLGSPRVVAADLNLLAAKTALANVRLNRMEDSVMVVQARAEDIIACPAELVIANLHYDAMRRLIDAEPFTAKKYFVLSGLMRREAKEISGQLSRRGIVTVNTWQHEGIWFTFYARRR